MSGKSKKQPTVSRSSNEGEYCAIAATVLLAEFKISHYKPAMLLCDNQSALHLAANPVFHDILSILSSIITSFEIKSLWLLSFKLFMWPLNIKFQIYLPKLLVRSNFNISLSRMGVLNIHTPSWGVSTKAFCLAGWYLSYQVMWQISC